MSAETKIESVVQVDQLARAAAELTLVDADVAYHYVDDGQLSEEPLHRPLSDSGRELRERRLAAVAALEAAGGRDPAPLFLRPPTQAQRDHYAEKPRSRETVEEKALRILAEGRLTVKRVSFGRGERTPIVAECVGDTSTYSLGYDASAQQWRCGCPATRKCSHLIALQLVARLPRGGE